SLALLPLIFWFMATFEPLNRYGDGVKKRLAEIERRVAPIFGTRATLGHFGEFAVPPAWQHRVRYRVGIAFSIVLGLWVACSVAWVWKEQREIAGPIFG